MFQAVGIKTGLFQQRFDKNMFKHCGTMPDDKDLFMILVILGIIPSIINDYDHILPVSR